MRQRWTSLVLWTLATCLVAGLYGALHNQVSYTISPDYFRTFKFPQFRFPAELRTRAGASIVGFLASWWTGLVIGPALFFVAYYRTGALPTQRMMRRGVSIVIAVTMTTGLIALIVAWVTTRTPLDVIWAPMAAGDPVAFQRAGILHDGSYLGGAIGLITACAVLAMGRPIHAPQPDGQAEIPTA